VSTRLRTVVKHRAFRYFFDSIIVLNAIFILFDLDGFEFGFLAVFILEILLKIYSFGFLMFSRKLWNIFDVVVIGSAFFISIIEQLREDTFDSNQVLDVMLVLRLLRVVKIFHSFERFKTVLATIVHILPSMLTYAGVLAVVFYMFAIVGMEVFADKIRFFGPEESSTADQRFCGNGRLQNSTFYQGRVFLYKQHHNTRASSNQQQALVEIVKDEFSTGYWP
jgi:two pore calcium channel protein 3